MKSNEGLPAPSVFFELVQAIYRDACAKCTADVSDLRDLKTIKSRVEKEGISFLTITLPRFARDFEQALQRGLIDPTLFTKFRKSGSGPAFLQGLIGQIFDYETGRIKDDQYSIGASDYSTIVDSVRQICLAFKKVELPCTPKRVAAALTSYITIEHDNQRFSPPKEEMDHFDSVSSVLWGRSLANISLENLVPKHGPGATADRKVGNNKYVWSRWHERLEPFFPLLGCAYSIGAYESKELEEISLIPEQDEQPVRVITVPKTLTSPRIIAIEPCCMQYSQQAIRRVLYDAIESSRFTRGRINFRDQSVNQELAIKSSKTGHLATIDLSDASDRVPRDLALSMFRSNPDLLDAIDACRSRSAKMPDGTLVSPLNKFASMGSALCFPVEAMYFYTCCVASLLREHDLPVNAINVYNVGRSVYVYGDDIILPSRYAVSVIGHLQKYNCKVNTSKTFVAGRFRESCGVDAYGGVQVTPVYIRSKRPNNRRQVQELISWVATGNLFYLKGYWRAASLMFAQCEKVLGPLPYVSAVSSGLGRVSVLGYRTAERWNRKLQRFEVKCWKPSPVYRSDSIDGYAALVKSLLLLGLPEEEVQADTAERLESGVDTQHLERYALHGAVVLKRRWLPSLI